MATMNFPTRNKRDARRAELSTTLMRMTDSLAVSLPNLVGERVERTSEYNTLRIPFANKADGQDMTIWMDLDQNDRDSENVKTVYVRVRDMNKKTVVSERIGMTLGMRQISVRESDYNLMIIKLSDAIANTYGDTKHFMV